MNTYAAAAKEKAAHPERFCPRDRCLWRLLDGRGNVKPPCPKHTIRAPERSDIPVGGFTVDILAPPPAPTIEDPYEVDG